MSRRQNSRRQPSKQRDGDRTRELFDALNPTIKDTKLPSGATAPSIPTIYNDVPKTVDKLQAQNPVEKVEQARTLAMQEARFRDGFLLRSLGHSYKIIKELGEGEFGFAYEALQTDTGTKVWIKTEPMTEDTSMKKFKTLKGFQNELLIMQLILKAKPGEAEHFVRLLDSGCTDRFKFIAMELLGDNLYTITRVYLNNAFTKSTALRVSIQMLRSIIDLHSLGYIHRFIKPHIYAIGIGVGIKTIHMYDFSLAMGFRDKTGKLIRPRKKLKILGALRYTSRHSHLNQELSRRDDLESWFYLSIEFFYLNVLPWRGDQISASVLYKKQKLFSNDLPRVFKKVPEEYSTIMKYINTLKYSDHPDYQYIMNQLEQAKLNNDIDFSLPYDWESLDTSSKNKSEEKKDLEMEENLKTGEAGSSADCEPKPNLDVDPSSSTHHSEATLTDKVSKFQTPKKAVDDLIDVNVSETDGKNHGDPLIQNVHLDLMRKELPVDSKSASHDNE